MSDSSTGGAYRKQGSLAALAVERERRRMAHELHDSVIQQLVLACTLIDQSRLAKPCDHLDRVRSLLDDSLAQLRSMLVVRTPVLLHQAGLTRAIELVSESLAQRWGVPYYCRVSGDPGPLSDAITDVLFLAVRELMTNVGRHANASRCDVLVEVGDAHVVATVSDDGIGVEPEPGMNRIPGMNGGFGLFSLRSLAGELGGELRFDLRDGGGTSVTLRLPRRSSTNGGCCQMEREPATS